MKSKAAFAAPKKTKGLVVLDGCQYLLRNGARVMIERRHTFKGTSQQGPWEYEMWRGHIVGTRQIFHWDLSGHYGANYWGHELDIVARV